MRSRAEQVISGAGGVLAAICHLVSLTKMELGAIALVGMQGAVVLFATFCFIMNILLALFSSLLFPFQPFAISPTSLP